MSLTKTLIFGCVLCLITFCYISPMRTLAQTKKPAESAQVDHAVFRNAKEIGNHSREQWANGIAQIVPNNQMSIPAQMIIVTGRKP